VFNVKVRLKKKTSFTVKEILKPAVRMCWWTWRQMWSDLPNHKA